MQWSSQQEAIFAHFRSGTGNLVVKARAGSGKTTTIVEGVNQAPDDKIFLCAFNKIIATELSNRIKNANAEAKTLNSVGFAYVRRNWTNVRIDGDRAERLARQVMGDEAPDAMVHLVKKLSSLAKGACPYPSHETLVDLAYEHDLLPDEEWEQDGWTIDRLVPDVMSAMDLACKRDGTVDFDDQIFVPLRNKWVRGSWSLIVVDEAQDMNVAQLLLAQRSVKKGGRIVVVGDDRQAIYGFRGADSGSIDRLKKELNAIELGLTITRRCPKLVVDQARSIVPDFEAAPEAPEGMITTIVGNAAIVAQAQPSDFVLSRKNAPLAPICLALLRAGKKAQIRGRDIGKGLVNLLKKVKGRSMPDFQARLTRWEEREVHRLKASGKKSAEARIEFVQDQAETLRELSIGLSGLNELTARIESLFSDTSLTGAVICSSVHKAKGLETDRVFLIEESFMRGGKVEERNIEYVAITRTKRDLVWVKAKAQDA